MTSVQNPLLFDEILRNITMYMDYKTLENARLVSHKWNEAMFSAFNEKAKLVMYFPAEDWIEAFLEDIPVPPSCKMKNRFKSVQIVQPSLLLNHRISNWMSKYGSSFQWIYFGLDNSTNSSSAFMKRNLKQEKSLEFSRHHPFCLSEVYRIPGGIIRSIFLNWCRNLKELRFSNIDTMTRDDGTGAAYNRLPAPPASVNAAERSLVVVNLETLFIGNQCEQNVIPLLKIIFGLTVSIKKMQLLQYRNNIRFFDNLIAEVNAMKGTPAMKVLENLMHLEVDFDTVKNCTALLSMIEFNNIKRLKLHHFQQKDTISPTRALMKLLGTIPFCHLEHLELAPLHLAGGSDFPRLNELKTLRVFVHVKIWKNSDLDFILQLPRLEVLDFKTNHNNDRDSPSILKLFGSQTHLSQIQHPNLRELKLRNVTEDDYGLISNCFPNLECLCIHPSVDIGSYLLRLSSFENLKKLEVHHCGAMDDFVQTVTDHLPSFRSLKELKFFSDSDYCDKRHKRPVTLNAEIFYEGFFKCSALASLELHNRINIPVQIYNSVVRHIQSRNNSLRIKFTSGYLKTEDGEDLLTSEWIY